MSDLPENPRITAAPGGSQAVESAASELVINYVIEKLSSRELNPGDRLEPERDLAARLGVSRASVREAIKVLNYMGFLDSARGSGNYISSRYDATVSSIMRVMYLRGEIDSESFITFRQMLELQAFDLALDLATDAEKQEMTQTFDLLDICKDDQLIFALDNRFHTLIVEASHNDLIRLNYSALSKASMSFMSDVFYGKTKKVVKGFETLQSFHRGMLEGILQHDREMGRKAILDHFNWTRRQ